MWNVAADAVAGELAHHRVALGLGEALDGVADVADRGPGPHGADPEPHALAGVGDQVARLRRHLADQEGARAVAVEAVQERRSRRR